MGIGNWISSKYESAKSTVTGAVSSASNYVEKKVDSAVHTARQAASDLYDRGKATLTSVSNTVAQTANNAEQWAEKKIGEARQTASQLYDRGRAGLSNVGEALKDDSNVAGKLKYVNPMFYTGKATEYAGKGLKAVGEGLNHGVEFLDKNSKHLPEGLKGQAGVAAGLLGFAGGLVEGTGSLVDWAGRVQQGDTKTLKDTAHTLQKVGEGAVYVDGLAREGTGKVLEALGNATDIDLLRNAGQGYQRLGRAEQSLAGEDTKKFVDTVGKTGAHYAMRVGELEGKAVEWVGDQTGSQTLQSAGERMQNNAQALQAQTHTGLVDVIDKAAAERGKEYQENGTYAITRDVTRVVAEVATVVVAPEAIIGKAGTVAKTADVASDVGKVVKATEAVTDTARVADKVGDAGRVANHVPTAGGNVSKTAEAVGDASKVADTAADLNKTAQAPSDVARAGDAIGDSGKAANATGDAAKTADQANDMGKAAQGTSNATKAADSSSPANIPWQKEDLGNGMFREVREVPDPNGGPAWKEVKTGNRITRSREVPANDGGNPWTEFELGNGQIQRSRQVPANDGGPDWSEVVAADGTTWRNRQVPDTDGKGPWNETDGRFGRYKQRYYAENGVNWQETISGNNRWRYREGGMDGLAQEAAARGTTSVQVAGPRGPITVNVHGGATPEELARIQAALDRMPPAAREHAKDIYLSHQLGEVMTPAGKVESGVGGMAGDGRMVLDRMELTSESRARRILYHESGHNADTALGHVSNQPPWGDGSSVSKYGARNGAEDFAETHRVVLQDWQRYQNMSAADWARESQAAKKMEIVRIYGGTVPSQADVQASTNILTRMVRRWNEFQDARNPG